MVTLDYELVQHWNLETDRIDLGSADEGRLRYNVFLGDIIFTIDELDISAKWGWIPLIDFAAALHGIVIDLQEKAVRNCTFEFTESEAAIYFRRSNAHVEISTNYSAGNTRISLDDLDTAVKLFSSKLVNDLSLRYPTILQNKYFCKLLFAKS